MNNYSTEVFLLVNNFSCMAMAQYNVNIVLN